jgi:hypothetical protein
MANGDDIPYQLRPNKFIDRQIFLEALTKVVPQKQHGRYVYISMGGKHLVDQEAVYRKIGIRNLYSFDGNADIVARQNCNRPHFSSLCEELHSSALAGELDRILKHFEPAEHLIVWLDYTNAERLAQLQEFGEILKRCQPGDVVRITMNANDGTLRGDWQKEGCAGPGEYRAKRLRDQLGDFFPAGVETIGDNGVPNVLSEAVSIVAASAAVESNRLFVPILLTSYADGQRMFTAAVLCLAQNDKLPDGLNGWEFLAKGWTKVTEISVPDLSIREKVVIDKHLSKGPNAIIKAVKFQPAGELDNAQRALRSYKLLHRFYPTFHAIGVQ